MALARAVQGASHTPQAITWIDADGDPVVLVGAVMSGRIEDRVSGNDRAITGTLTITSGPNGAFEWDYGTADVADAGKFRVQFIATFGIGDMDKSMMEDWEVERAI